MKQNNGYVCRSNPSSFSCKIEGMAMSYQDYTTVKPTTTCAKLCLLVYAGTK